MSMSSGSGRVAALVKKPELVCFMMTVKYNGARFSGWQRQRTTQKVMECHKVDTTTGAGPRKGKIKRKTAGPNSFYNTVQDEIESALVRLTGTSVADLRVRASSRTDAGVHANGEN
jgi:hypothetical protein